MATEVLIPKLGMTMTEGIVAEWHIADGAEVRKGESIYRLETEKIEFEVEADADGIVRHLVRKGTKLVPGTVVAYILAPGEPMPAGAPPAVASGAAVEGQRADVAADPQRASAPASGDRPVLASPLARRLAEKLGVDLARVQGTGPGGRITQEDVEAAAAAKSSEASGEVIPLRAMRRTIAERMHASLQEMAQLTMGMDVDMTEAVKLRTRLVEEWSVEGIRPSYTDLVIAAVARALRRHPLLNSQLTAQGIELLDAIHVGMAVALDDGLVVPVVRNADSLSLQHLARETTRLAESARSGKLTLDEMAGASFSVTALGMAGVDFFTPIINPPNVAILGVGRIRDAVAWDGDRPVKIQQVTLSLTIDHRVVDGAPGAAFLGTVRDLLEAPSGLLA